MVVNGTPPSPPVQVTTGVVAPPFAIVAMPSEVIPVDAAGEPVRIIAVPQMPEVPIRALPAVPFPKLRATPPSELVRGRNPGGRRRNM